MGGANSKAKMTTAVAEAVADTVVAPPAPPAPAPLSPFHDPHLTGAERGRHVLTSLLHANASFVSGDSPPQSQISTPDLRRQLANFGQKPDAVVVACADSRVAPEIVFGAGIGRVFVIRNAGNVTWGDSVVGSIEFAVSALKAPLVMVLGHSLCGAVSAAVGTVRDGTTSDGGPLSNHVDRIAQVIKPCVGGQEEIRDSVFLNVKESVKSLREGSNAVGNAYFSGDIAIVGAVYDLHTGEVTVIDE